VFERDIREALASVYLNIKMIILTFFNASDNTSHSFIVGVQPLPLFSVHVDFSILSQFFS
jgi:hypothetical protein